MTSVPLFTVKQYVESLEGYPELVDRLAYAALEGDQEVS